MMRARRPPANEHLFLENLSELEFKPLFFPLDTFLATLPGGARNQRYEIVKNHNATITATCTRLVIAPDSDIPTHTKLWLK
jgi:hypothetical protein